MYCRGSGAGYGRFFPFLAVQRDLPPVRRGLASPGNRTLPVVQTDLCRDSNEINIRVGLFAEPKMAYTSAK
jgi:hypothetical protein